MGSHRALPSAQQLSELIAQAELGLLLRAPELPDELASVAWYLHGIASSREATRTYGTSRQRAAFQVCGHIFDLLLHDPKLTPNDRLTYCLAGQIASIRSDLDPNAIALYRRVGIGSLGADALDIGSRLSFRALSAAAAMLGGDLRSASEIARSGLDEVRDLRNRWQITDLAGSPFGASTALLAGIDELLAFLSFGDVSAIPRAYRVLERGVREEAAVGDLNARWAAAHLANLARDLPRSSVWTALPDGVPTSVRRAFAIGTPRVVSLWPPQLEFVAAGGDRGISAFSPEATRLFLSTPTSGGKTLIAHLLILNHVATATTGVCYVAPTRSLCAEVRGDLDSRLRFLGADSLADLPEGDWLQSIVPDTPRVEVMTPERLWSMISTDATGVLSRFGLFVFDEAHTVGDSSRGWVVEQSLSFLHFQTRDTGHRIVLMSAVLGNRSHFVQWMSEDGHPMIATHSDWRGPRRLHAVWTTTVDWGAARIEAAQSRDYPQRRVYPLHGSLHIRLSHAGSTRHVTTAEPIGEIKRRVDAAGNEERQVMERTPGYRMLVVLIRHLGVSGPVLVVEATRPSAVRMAKAIAEREPQHDQERLRPLLDLVSARLGETHPLFGVLAKGVGYHHGSLPREIRLALENAVAAGHLRYIVATTTMTEGVNLPVRSVVIAAEGSHTSDGFSEYISGAKLINAIGRAGRAAKETEGIAVLARPSSFTAGDFDRMDPDRVQMDAVSNLLTVEALREVATFEELRLAAEDAVLELGEGPVSSFISFVWFLAASVEASASGNVEAHVQGVLAHSLMWVQANDGARNAWERVAKTALLAYNRTDATKRRRWASAGTCVRSASIMDELATELAGELVAREIPSSPVELVDVVFGNGRLERMLSLSEAPRRPIYTRRARGRREITIPLLEFLSRWLRGSSLLELAGLYMSTVDDIDFMFEQLGDFLTSYCELFLPWSSSVLISWANSKLNDASIAQRMLPTSFPAYIRYGVDQPIAVRLMACGVYSRDLALRIARGTPAAVTPAALHRWLGSMTVQEWQALFSPDEMEVRNLLDYARDRQGVALHYMRGEMAELEVRSLVTASAETVCTVQEQRSTARFSPLTVSVAGNAVAVVLARDHVDLRDLLGAGIAMRASYRAESGRGMLVVGFSREPGTAGHRGT